MVSMCEKLMLCILVVTVPWLVQSKLQDWLINDIDVQSQLIENEADGSVTLTNGLISRTFLRNPGFTTINYYSNEKKTSVLRALSPEAVVQLDNITYNVGSVALPSTMSRSYLNRTAIEEHIGEDPTSFRYVGHSHGKPEAPFPYKPMRGAPTDIVWPPSGLRLDVNFAAPELPGVPNSHSDVTITVHYEIYDGIPAMTKWVSVKKPSSFAIIDLRVTIISVEILAVNEPFTKVSSWDSYNPQLDKKDNAYDFLYVETNKAHGAIANWLTDPSQSSSPGSYQSLLNVTYSEPIPSLLLRPGQSEVSFRVHELLHCAIDSTRKSLAVHRLQRLLSPQIQENPIFFHMVNSNSEAFRATVDQLAEVGFEMIIYSFGSGFNFESENETYIQQIKEDVTYASSKGIEVGGYDLIVLDRGNLPKEYRVTDAEGRPGENACLASVWYDVLYTKITNFIDKTNLTMVETDGPYGGTVCHSVTHSHHEDFKDSVYQQTHLQEAMYHELRRRNIYINTPDMYYYAGGNKMGLGYNENQYSLPRWEDLSVSRQTMFDRLYTLSPTAGWMFLPLTVYHGGGAAAEFEPLSAHLTEFNFGLAQYLGAGVAACYRGKRIYDTEETKQLVTKWVSFYKKYRPIITSDIVRIIRPDMQGIDAFIHVNYKLEGTKGLAMVFNPTPTKRSMNLTLPLYYTGLKREVAISEQENGFVNYEMDVGPHGWEVDVPVHLDPYEVTWFFVRNVEKTKKQKEVKIQVEDVQEIGKNGETKRNKWSNEIRNTGKFVNIEGDGDNSDRFMLK